MQRSIRWMAMGPIVMAAMALALTSGAMAHEGHANNKTEAQNNGPVTLTGEVVDLMCYLDHGAHGEHHQACAKKCIRSGGPVGLRVTNDQSGEQSGEAKNAENEDQQNESSATTYLIIGQHKPMNDKLVKAAAKKVTLRGKVVERNGMKMIENAKIVNIGDVVKDKSKQGDKG